jgi:dienelactone hydrolase
MANPFPQMPPSCSRDDFSSRGATVRAALCLPGGAARVPGVVVLHGCGGFNTFDHRLAVELPQAGVATLYIDYFDPTPAPSSRGFCSGGGALEGAFSVWGQEVVDALATLKRAARVDSARVGLVGWSLGGGLAVASAAAGAVKLQALVGFSTGAFGSVSGVANLPPTLLLSGGTHDAIPLSSTEQLYRALRAAGVPATLYVYPDGVHQWPTKQGSAGIAVAERFLHRRLG